MEIFDGWKRPNEIFTTESKGPAMASSTAADLVQDLTTDCSVVASLCAGTSRAEKGHAKVGSHYSIGKN